eukprot:CAMPEP_0167808174 /NCGR_PEP_ID=MMETSP0111_2-20121227/23021_1 /TAXON_ID=91324 /ORGANISM="Lotharella globosa, Strain CCCM811" /LENGTH=127 /DNA_ID=CAMNT_0007706277 /DNA_START=548 /DNA_END=931 /DNA_ORIENTATION=+
MPSDTFTYHRPEDTDVVECSEFLTNVDDRWGRRGVRKELRCEGVAATRRLVQGSEVTVRTTWVDHMALPEDAAEGLEQREVIKQKRVLPEGSKACVHIDVEYALEGSIRTRQAECLQFVYEHLWPRF